MARKKKHPEHVNHERWLVSYADFITLLFATFTALFAISNRDMEKFKKLAASIKEAFSEGPKTLIQEPSVTQNGGADPHAPLVINITPVVPAAASGEKGETGEEHPGEMFDGVTNLKSAKQGQEPPNGAAPAFVKTNAENPAASPKPTPTASPQPTVTPASAAALAAQQDGAVDPALAQEIKELIDTTDLKGKVDMHQEQRGMVISLGEAGFFDSGSVDVRPESTHQLDRIANALRNKNLEIRVEGHTDNIPVRSGRFRSNLELSGLRAAHIDEFLVNEYHFAPDRLSSAGYGEYRPVADNVTPEGRRKNRRVDIVILNRRAAQAEPHPEPSPQTSPQTAPLAK